MSTTLSLHARNKWSLSVARTHVCVCVCHKVQWKDKEQSGGLGEGSGIAKVNLALCVIYWHITRLTPLVRVCMYMCEKPV